MNAVYIISYITLKLHFLQQLATSTKLELTLQIRKNVETAFVPRKKLLPCVIVYLYSSLCYLW